MTLRNLIGRSLEEITPSSSVIQKLIGAAERNIADSKLEQLSDENRFDVAYKSIMQLANAALQANGYRTLTSKPGHHQTMLQTLPKTIGLDNDIVIMLDTLRKQRNIIDYSGDLIPPSAIEECINQASSLYLKVNNWIKKNHPELMK